MPATQYTALVTDAARRDSEAAEQALAAAERRVQGRTQPDAGRRRDVLGALPPDSALRVVRSLRPHAARSTVADGARGRDAARSAPPRGVVSRVRAASRRRRRWWTSGPCRRSTGWWRSGAPISPPKRSPRRRSRCAAGVGANLGRRLAAAGLGSPRASPQRCQRGSSSSPTARSAWCRSPRCRWGSVRSCSSAARSSTTCRPNATSSPSSTHRRPHGPARHRRTVVQRPPAVPRPSPPASATATATTTTTLPRPSRRGDAVPRPAADHFQPLVGTRQEVRDLSGVWNTSAATTSGTGPGPARSRCQRDGIQARRRRAPRAASGDARILPERRLRGGVDRHPWRRRPVLRRPAARSRRIRSAVRPRPGRRQPPRRSPVPTKTTASSRPKKWPRSI